MATKATGRPPSAKTLVDRQLGRNIVHPILPAGDSFIVPNHSGDHSEGRVDRTPVRDLDIVNKAYVDALTTDHPHQDVRTTASPTFAGLTSTDEIHLNKAGTNIITATNASGTLQLGAGGGTNDLKIDTDGNVEIFENLKVDGGTIDLSAAATEFVMKPSTASAYTITESGREWLNITTAPVNDIAWGNTTDNPQTRYIGTGQVAMGGALNVVGKVTCSEFEVKNIMRITDIGGIAILIKNLTGGLSVKGETVTASATAGAVAAPGNNELQVIGVFLTDNVPNNVNAWVVISGVAEVKADGTGWSAGDRIVTSITAGRCVTNNAPSVAVHFQEIGHAIEAAGANELGKVVLHFN